MSSATPLLFLVAVSLCGIIDVAEYERVSSGDRFVYAVVILLSFTKASLLLMGFRYIKRIRRQSLRRATSLAARILVVAYTVLCLVNAFSFKAYGFGISLRMMNILLHTSVRETMEYMPIIADGLLGALPYVAGFAVLLLLVSNVCGMLVQRINQRTIIVSRAILYLSTLVCLAFYLFNYSTGRNSVCVYLRTAKSFVQVRTANARAAEMASHPIVLPFAETVKCDSPVNNFVLVIGESADKRHCSAYGYSLPTNRHTMQLTDSLLWFTRAKAPFCGTEESLTRLLTFMDDGPDTDVSRWSEYPNLVSVLKQAGYYCYWISNQQRLGNCMDCTTIIGGLCDEKIWLQDYDYDALLSSHDEALLPHFRKALADTCQNRFVVVHLMGAHPEYRKRYPKEAERFTYADTKPLANKATSKSEWQRIAEYDNAMLYTDSIVAEVLKTLFKQPGRNVLLYLSDHGQNVYDTSAHFSHDELHVDVPMMMYLSEEWRKANPQQMASLTDSLDKPIATANLIHTILRLADVRYKLCK